eukprot:GHVO01041773.1.p1 GENE.GHVO01041773.1~~GHVO01041773.1.p1  ORF type:complete len:130 (+),score=4.23 GHVO01041773.1:124-513(+)
MFFFYMQLAPLSGALLQISTVSICNAFLLFHMWLFNFIAYGSCSFETYVDESAEGASKVANANSLDDCLDACVDDTSNCYAVEYSEDYGCYRHTTTYAEGSMKSNSGVTIYKYKSCTGMAEFILLQNIS